MVFSAGVENPQAQEMGVRIRLARFGRKVCVLATQCDRKGRKDDGS